MVGIITASPIKIISGAVIPTAGGNLLLFNTLINIHTFLRGLKEGGQSCGVKSGISLNVICEMRVVIITHFVSQLRKAFFKVFFTDPFQNLLKPDDFDKLFRGNTHMLIKHPLQRSVGHVMFFGQVINGNFSHMIFHGFS
jgi:hypothetical protein